MTLKKKRTYVDDGENDEFFTRISSLSSISVKPSYPRLISQNSNLNNPDCPIKVARPVTTDEARIVVQMKEIEPKSWKNRRVFSQPVDGMPFASCTLISALWWKFSHQKMYATLAQLFQDRRLKRLWTWTRG